MLCRIVKKELLSNIKTLRFPIGTALFLTLVVLFTFILIGDYSHKLENYNELVLKNETELRQLMTYQNLKPTVYKPPEVFAVFSKGVMENLGNSAHISIGEVPIPQSAASEKNFLLSVFPVLDIVLIFKVVISIFVLLLAYDAISGEKEDRTLGLMLSNSVQRYKILLGKFTGGMITIAIPIALGFIVQGILLSVSPIIHLTVSDWVRIVLIFFTSLIMVGVIFSLGLLISSLTKRASDTLIFLLFLWILFVFIVPNLSTYFAGQIKSIESREKIDARVQGLWNDFNTHVQGLKNDFYKDIIEAMKKNPENAIDIGARYGQSDEREPWGYYHSFATKSLIRFEQELYANTEPLKIETADKAWQTENTYLESLKQQKKLSDILSRFSPVSVYEILISGLSRSDVSSYENFYDQIREYRNQTIDYLYDKDAFSSIRYFATVKEEHLFDPKDGDEYTVLRDKYGGDEALPLNMDDYPRFNHRQESVAATVIRILPDMALLTIMGILFFLCAFVFFLKYDVR